MSIAAARKLAAQKLHRAKIVIPAAREMRRITGGMLKRTPASKSLSAGLRKLHRAAGRLLKGGLTSQKLAQDILGATAGPKAKKAARKTRALRPRTA